MISLRVSTRSTRRPAGPSSASFNWFFEWDFNAAFIRDFLNPCLYLTFQDSKGTIVGPVAYNASFISWGPKVEFGLRNRFGYLGVLKDISLESIPKRLDMGVGWDYGWSVSNVGMLWTTVSFQDVALTRAQGDLKENLKVKYVGFGNAIGVTRINSGGHYTRLPYLFTPSWNAKQWTFILFGNFASMSTSMVIWVFLAVCFYVFVMQLSDSESKNLWLNTHTVPPKNQAEKEEYAAISKKQVSLNLQKLSKPFFYLLGHVLGIPSGHLKWDEEALVTKHRTQILQIEEESFKKSLFGKVFVFF
jgi:hypothetical protein